MACTGSIVVCACDILIVLVPLLIGTDVTILYSVPDFAGCNLWSDDFINLLELGMLTNNYKMWHSGENLIKWLQLKLLEVRPRSLECIKNCRLRNLIYLNHNQSYIRK